MAFTQAKLSQALNHLAAEMPQLQEISNFYLAISKSGLYPCPKNAFFDFVFPNVSEPAKNINLNRGFYVLQLQPELELYYLYIKKRIQLSLEDETLRPINFQLQIDHHVTFLTGSALSSLTARQDAMPRSLSTKDNSKANESASFTSSSLCVPLSQELPGLPSPCQTYFPQPSERFQWNHPRFELNRDNLVKLAMSANLLMVDTFRRFHNLVSIWTSCEFLTYQNADLSSTISNYAHFSRSIVPQTLDTFQHECPLLERLENDSSLLRFTEDGNELFNNPIFSKLSNQLLDQVHTFNLDLQTEDLFSLCSPLCKFHHFTTGETKRFASPQASFEDFNDPSKPLKTHVCLCQSMLLASPMSVKVQQDPSNERTFPPPLVDETRLSHLSREIVSALPHLRATFAHWNKLFREPDILPTLIGCYLNRDILALILLPAIRSPPTSVFGSPEI
jgi:hypothetical protein